MKHKDKNKRELIPTFYLSHLLHLNNPFFQVLRDKSTKLNDSKIRDRSADQVEELSIKE